jgi:hypothetical protein
MLTISVSITQTLGPKDGAIGRKGNSRIQIAIPMAEIWFCLGTRCAGIAASPEDQFAQLQRGQMKASSPNLPYEPITYFIV